MKLKNVKTPRFRKGGYVVAVTLSLCLACLLFGASSIRVGAQRAHRRITSVWTATSAEGSRVTVTSDTDLTDSEAYTRGDRFYVKIPRADLPTTTGSLLGRGFDDVQIQRVGDGILLSFRLQPGTSSRVEQKLNRIEVVFSIPMRSGVAGNEVASRPRARRIQDMAGPAPPTSTRENQTAPRSGGRHAERGARTTGSTRDSSPRPAAESHRSGANDRHGSPKEAAVATPSPRASSTNAAKQPHASPSPTPGSQSASKGSTEKGTTPSASPLPSPSPISSPSPVASPSSSALAVASPSATPLAGQASAASASPTPATIGSSAIDWKSKLHYLEIWIRLNPWPLLIFGLVFMALLLLLFVRGGRKRRRRSKARWEPKPVTPAAGPDVANTAKPNAKPVVTEPAGATAGQNRVETSSPNSVSSPAAPNHASEDPDREVFEL